MSFAATGQAGLALLAFGAFYAACLALTRWCYVRTVGLARLPGLAHARV